MTNIKNISELVADENTFNGNLPNVFCFDITDRCQMKCITCSKWQTPADVKDSEMNTDDWKNAILKIKNWVGKYTFIFSGGEPFLRPDIFEIIQYADSLDVSITVVSNAFMLENLAEHVVNSKISSLIISLNSLNPEKHDSTRGVNNSFDKAFKAIEKIISLKKQLNSNLKLNLSTIVMPQNLDDIIPLVEWAKNSSLDGISLQLQEDDISFHSFFKTKQVNTLVYSEKMSLLNEYEKVRDKAIEVINQVIKMKEEGAPVRNSYKHLEAMKIFLNNPKDILDIKCLVGKRNFSVDPYGNVRLCYNMAPVGKINIVAPEQIWNSNSSNTQRNLINNCKMYCRLANCNFKRDNQV